MGLTVRQGVPTDDAALVSVKRAAIEDDAAGAYTPEEVAAWSPDVETVEGYAEGLERDEYLPLVGELDGEVIGYGVLNVESGSLLALYVDPDHRGTGVGSTLLGQIETSARFAGARTLDLLASRNAVGFYEARGYERGETVERDVHGASLAFVEMSKPLAVREVEA